MVQLSRLGPPLALAAATLLLLGGGAARVASSTAAAGVAGTTAGVQVIGARARAASSASWTSSRTTSGCRCRRARACTSTPRARHFAGGSCRTRPWARRARTSWRRSRSASPGLDARCSTGGWPEAAASGCVSSRTSSHTSPSSSWRGAGGAASNGWRREWRSASRSRRSSASTRARCRCTAGWPPCAGRDRRPSRPGGWTLSTLGSPRDFTLRHQRAGSVETYHLTFLLADYLIERHGLAKMVEYFGRLKRHSAFGYSIAVFETQALAHLQAVTSARD